MNIRPMTKEERQASKDRDSANAPYKESANGDS